MDVWESLKEELSQRTFYLVNRSGPTLFCIRDEDGKIHRVIIGSPHRCTCQISHTHPCIHMMYIVLKVLRIPETNDICKRMNFNDGEIERILGGYYEAPAAPARALRRAASKPATPVAEECVTAPCVTRHELSDSDICPICQDDMTEKDALTWCREGCGNNLHAKCMKMFAQFKIAAKTSVLCPFCRSDWGSSVIATLNADLRQKLPQNPCAPVTCDSCRMTVHGRFLRCVPCAMQKDYIANVLHKSSSRKCNFCSECATAKHVGKEHQGHSFVASQSQAVLCDAQWATADNPFSAAHSAQNNLLRQLQYREISDSDYNDLLALEQNETPNLPALLLSALSYAPPLAPCTLCSCEASSATAIMKTLPCTHTVHATCMEKAIQDALAVGSWKLDAIKCQAPEFSYRCIFRGLSRRRFKNKVPKKENIEHDTPDAGVSGPMRLEGLSIGGITGSDSDVIPTSNLSTVTCSRMNINQATLHKINNIRTNAQSSRSAGSAPRGVDMSIGSSMLLANGSVGAPPRGSVKLPRLVKGPTAMRRKTTSTIHQRAEDTAPLEFSISGSQI